MVSASVVAKKAKSPIKTQNKRLAMSCYLSDFKSKLQSLAHVIYIHTQIESHLPKLRPLKMLFEGLGANLSFWLIIAQEVKRG